VKWIADAKLTDFRARVAEALKDPALNVRMASALATALARLDGQDVSEAKMADMFIDRLSDAASAPALKAQALKLVPVTHPRLTVSLLAKLIALGDRDLKLEAVRALSEHPNPRRFPALLLITRDTAEDTAVRAQAIAGLAERSQEYRPDLFDFALGDDATFRDEALRALVGTEMAPAYRRLLEPLTQRDPATAALASRVLGKPFVHDRPALSALDAWRARLEGPADAEAGRRIVFHPKLAACSRCHRIDGRGHDVGPDLSTIGRIDRRRILESILQPSNDIGPSYQAWQLATSDGKVATGMLIHTNLDAYTYIDAKGIPFTLRTPEIVERSPQSTSIMPAGLADLLTDQEVRDLLAYLTSRR
jgi:putative heme-binding domain-containing protein